MDWLLANLKLVIFLAVIVIYAIKAVRSKAESASGERPETMRRTMPGEHDAEEAERTRQIQEEIRRRILARQRGEVAAPLPEAYEEAPPAPPPLPPPVPENRPVVAVDDPYARAAAEVSAREASILESQRAFEEQLRQIKLAREMASAGVPRLAPSRPEAEYRRGPGTGLRLRDDLKGRASLRRAILLREVLGEPIALRRGPGGVARH